MKKDPETTKEIVTIGIDSSTTNCGLAFYYNAKFISASNIEFKGTYSLNKLDRIVKVFAGIFKVEKPDIVVIEATVPSRKSRSLTSLNQVFGAIFAAAYLQGATVIQINNKMVKSYFKFKEKSEAIKIANSITNRDNLTEHEADAILLVEFYIKNYTKETLCQENK